MTQSQRIAEFDIWRPGYGGSLVDIFVAGTTTRAAVYLDPLLTVPGLNPQLLISETGADGVVYGKWERPVYVGVPYQLLVSGDELTGTQLLPLYTLAGADASLATVIPTGGVVARTLKDLAADAIRVASFGTLGTSSATNTTILAAAIGAAAAAGGGLVLTPAGNYPFTTFTLPADVVLEGEGRGVTTLRSSEAQACVTLGGNRAGLRRLTLDGVNLVGNSIGLYSVGRLDPVLDDVEIKRFAKGWLNKGGDRPMLRQFFVSNCVVGCEIRGDTDAATSAAGGPVRGLNWNGGKVDLCSTTGILLSFEDAIAEGFAFFGVDFLDNTGTALTLNGARNVRLHGGRFQGNTGNLSLQDDSDLSRISENTVKQFEAEAVRFVDGTLTFNGTCEKVRFSGCEFENADFALSIPTNPIVLQDCSEDAATTVSGAAEKLLRTAITKRGEVPGVTTDATWTPAWSTSLSPGDMVRIRARVIGRQRDGINTLSGEIVGTGFRAPADLSFDTAVGTLAVGSIIAGISSGASGRIVASTQSGTTGTVSLRDILGDFLMSESLSTSAGQTAKCSAPLTNPAVTVTSADVVKDGASPQTDSTWNYTIDAATPLVRVLVKGAASQIIEWLVEVDVVRP